jgi:hypothetical protein
MTSLGRRAYTGKGLLARPVDARVRPGGEWGRDALLVLGSTRVAWREAQGLAVAGPPRRARTAAHGEARCEGSRSGARERGRRRDVLKQPRVALFD